MNSNVLANEISYVEAHGTGTIVGGKFSKLSSTLKHQDCLDFEELLCLRSNGNVRYWTSIFRRPNGAPFGQFS